MIDFIGVETVQKIVAATGLGPFLEGLTATLETDYRRWPEFDKSARHATHLPQGVIELMAISDGRLYSFKYVNGHPKNTAAGLLTVAAFGVLADVKTGYPLLVSELTLATALRTAAMSALAARHLARRNSKVMALIGNGAQSEFQAMAFYHLLGIRELRLYDKDLRATAKLERNLRRANLIDLPRLNLVRCASVAEAVHDADIVTTATADKRMAAILTPDMIVPGMHLNMIGGDCPGKTELHRDILLRSDVRVVVEYEPQSRIEGEIQQVDARFPVTEFADILAGTAPGRSSDADVTLFDSVGFALEDFSALRYLYERYQALSPLQQRIDLIPELDDPKDLFGLLKAGPEAVPRSSTKDRFETAEAS